MTRTNNWTDEDWLLLLQLYLRKPVGLKPPYSRPVVDLALELHVPPGELFARMCSVANLETPLLERMWQKYGANPRRLARVAALLRSMAMPRPSTVAWPSARPLSATSCL